MNKYSLLFISFLFLQNITAQRIKVNTAYKMDAENATMQYIFPGDRNEGILVINHDENINEPFNDFTLEDKQVCSIYGFEMDEMDYLFSLFGNGNTSVNAIAQNDDIEAAYLLVECGDTLSLAFSDGGVFDQVFVDSLNTVLVTIYEDDSVRYSRIIAPENTIQKVTPFGDVSILSGVFKDTLIYVDHEGQAYKYFTDDPYNAYFLAIDSLGLPKWIHFSRGNGLSFVRSVVVDPSDSILYLAHDIIFGSKVQTLNKNGEELSEHYMNGVAVHHIDFDEQGNMGWCGNYDTFGFLPDMDPSPDSLFFPISDSKDAFVIKFEGTVKPTWYQVVGGENIDTGTNFDFDENGGAYLTGCIQRDGIFDNGTETFFARGLEDIFLTHYLADGSYDWTYVFGGNSSDIGFNVQSDEEDIYLSGIFRREMDMDPSEGELILVDENDDFDESSFWAYFTVRSLSNDEIFFESKNTLFPNPSNGHLYSHVPLNKILVFDLQGHLMHSQVLGQEYQINLSHLQTGTYILRRIGKKGTSISEKIQIVK